MLRVLSQSPCFFGNLIVKCDFGQLIYMEHIQDYLEMFLVNSMRLIE